MKEIDVPEDWKPCTNKEAMEIFAEFVGRTNKPTCKCITGDGTYELEVYECQCGFHIGFDSSYLDQVGDITITCPACLEDISTIRPWSHSRFENAKEMHEKHPETFHLDIDYGSIKAGDYVKACDKTCEPSERFWIKVTAIDGDLITGTVANTLLFSDLKFDDEVMLKLENIYDHQPEETAVTI